MADELVITVYDNGPYVVRGRVELHDARDEPFDTGGRPSVALCRCGGSRNKPFCDGTHAEIGFEAEERAGPRDEA